MHAEFVACYGAAVQATWLRNLISELSIVDSVTRPILLYWDNLAAVLFAKNNKNISGSKHMDIKYLTTKELVKKGDITVEHIRTEDMIVDPLTKGLRPNKYQKHVLSIGLAKFHDTLS